MTRIDKSDAQLNAEAAERQRKIAEGAEWTPPSYGSESGYRATPAPPPIRRNGQPDSLTLWRAAAFAEPPQRVHQKPTAEMGMDLADQLVRYIDGSAGHFPVHDALLVYLDRECRRLHRGPHWWDHEITPDLCGVLMRRWLSRNYSVNVAADELGISFPRAERLLKMAFRTMRYYQQTWLEGSQVTVPHDFESCHECIMADRQRREAHDPSTCQTCIRATRLDKSA